MDHDLSWQLVGSELCGKLGGAPILQDRIFHYLREERPSFEINGIHLEIKPYPLRPLFGVYFEVLQDGIIPRVAASIGEVFALVNERQSNVVIDNRLALIQPSSTEEFKAELLKFGLEVGVPMRIKEIVQFLEKDSGVKLFGITNLEASALSHDVAQVLLPDTIKATLFGYQLKGFSYLNLMRSISSGCVLGDEMGLGKTMQAIAFLCSELKHERQPNLVVCPATLCKNWANELNKFAPSIVYTEHSGKFRTGSSRVLRSFDVVIMSYETLIADETLVSRVAWNCVFLDEAQAIKTPVSKRTLVAKSLSRQFSLAITGTPIENHLEDLWSILDFAEPSVLGDLQKFRQNFSDDESDARELSRLTSPLILRRKVNDVENELPELIQAPQALPLSDREAIRYQEILESISSGDLEPLPGSQKLRMLCAHSNLDAEEFNQATKTLRVVEILEEAFLNKRKVLIFGSYQHEIDSLVECVREIFPSSYVGYIDGRINPNLRTSLVEKFTEHTGPGCLVLNPRAAGVGLNITAATYVVHFNPEWNPAITDQATKRAHRTGSTETVTAFHLYYQGTIEEKIVERATFRRNMAAEGAPGSSDEPKIQDIASLLGITI
jgi:SNF2 family DNA or RNA helicase